ncbi:MAG TPA: hypothetical protein VGF28_25920 [Thermoanaerobaculia bacterium]|jgi:tetratricopeptide (TPR) repeat protein
MSHLTERTLGLFAIDPARVSPADAAHLRSCSECQAALRDLREFEKLLREPESWTGVAHAARRAGVDELREFAVRSAEEDEEALRLLEEFSEPGAAARFVSANIPARPEYQTGGVARLLCRWANGMCVRKPLYALKLAEAATVISQMLPDASYPRKTIHELRGDALKEQANALRFLGRFPEALVAVENAEIEYRKLPQESPGLVGATLVRGTILFEQDDLEGAQKAAAEAAHAALRVGDAARHLSARNLLGYILFERYDHTAAAKVFEASLQRGIADADAAAVAADSLSLGLCCLEIGKLGEASRFLQDALRYYTAAGSSPFLTRTHWAVARLIFAQGNPYEAIYRLQRCIDEFTRFEILSDAALVAVDLAEVLNAVGRTGQISKVLAGTVKTFIDAGKLTSALTALAYLKDATGSGSLTPELFEYIRRFVRRAERQPELLFAPPPRPL